MAGRTGLLGKKIGMTRMFSGEGVATPVTLVDVNGCQVVTVKTAEKDGYTAVQVGIGEAKDKNITKPMRGHFAKNNVEKKQVISEFRVNADAVVKAGAEISADHFVADQYVDVSGVSIGKGFAGAMKRHNFGGLRASHGVSISHRSHGSTGQCQDPGKVFKGKKMAGQLGNKKQTVQNLRIVLTDPEKGLIAIEGSIPGAKGSYVKISDAVKKAVPPSIPYPASIKGANTNKANDEVSKKETESADENVKNSEGTPDEN